MRAGLAKTANGDILLGAVARGEVVAETGFGTVDIGVLDGLPAWLELKTNFGNLRNGSMPPTGPEPGEEAVEIRARTGYGDITIHRSADTDHEGSEPRLTAGWSDRVTWMSPVPAKRRSFT